MQSRITLTITGGTRRGQEFIFDERTTCIVGRETDCALRLPSDDEHRLISRHHCLLDINPPFIRVRDFGSLNGTYLNGQMIGQRGQGQPPAQAALFRLPEHDLKHGDEITLGGTTICVRLTAAARCRICSAEIPVDRQAEFAVGPDIFECRECAPYGTVRDVVAVGADLPAARRCSICGRDVSSQLGPWQSGSYICQECQQDPTAIIVELLSQARSGRQELVDINGYAIERQLGKGGMGAVYLARHEQSGNRVALKLMLPQIAAEQHAVSSFLRETENTRALQHKNVVKFHAAGNSKGAFFMTLEYCEAGSIKQLMERSGGKLPVEEAGPLMLQVLDGLSYAHRAVIPNVKQKDGRCCPGRGLVHRDLKPHNVMLTGTGPSRVAKVGDYGLSKAFDLAGLSGHTCTGAGSFRASVAGTPAFMSREQVRNFKYARPDVDVWAAAATLYNMLTAAYPRDFTPDHDRWLTVLEREVVPIRKRNPTIPRPLAEVIDAALVETPRIGFQSAHEFRAALERVL